MKSVLQDWVMELSLREQGTLLGALRGCDTASKHHTSKGLVRYYRFCVLNPADVRETRIEGAYMFYQPPTEIVKLSQWDDMPVHWVLHMLHGIEVIGYRHPDYAIRIYFQEIYRRLVYNMHLSTEYASMYEKRMTEDRTLSDVVD